MFESRLRFSAVRCDIILQIPISIKSFSSFIKNFSKKDVDEVIYGGYNQATSHKPQATSHKPQATSYNYALIAERKNTETNALTFGRINPECEGDFLCLKGDVYSWSKKF